MNAMWESKDERLESKAAVKKNSRLLFVTVALGTVAMPMLNLVLVWLGYFSLEKGWAASQFLDPYSPKEGLWMLAICVLGGLLSFNKLLDYSFSIWNLKRWRWLIHLILSVAYVVLTVAILVVGTFIIACSFGDCL